MRTKLIFSTELNDIEQWTNLPFIPRINEWINLNDILQQKELLQIKQTAYHWSGIQGIVQSVEYRHDNDDFYSEIYIWCED